MAESGSKNRVIGYWVATALVALAMGAGGVAELVMRNNEEMIEGLANLGYPPYLLIILGVAKILGTIAVLMPGFARLKEWAYAGFTIDLLGASASHAFSGDPAQNIITPLVVWVIVLASWWLRPESRKLPDRPKGVFTEEAASE